jgi:FkbM family methyltransferase
MSKNSTIARGSSIDVELLKQTNPGVFDEVVTRNAYNVTEGCFSGQLVVDIGAHIGTFSFMALTVGHAKHLVAIEPNPKNYSILRAAFQHVENVGLWPGAVSGSHSSVVISDDDNNSKIGQQGTRVPAIDLACVIKPYHSWYGNATLKMDIEGSEYDVLWSASRYDVRFFHTILLETHGNAMLNSAMTQYLACFGYRWVSQHQMSRWDVLPDGTQANHELLPAWVSRFEL